MFSTWIVGEFFTLSALRRSEPLWRKHMQRYDALERQHLSIVDEMEDGGKQQHHTFPKMGLSRASSVGSMDSFAK